MGGPVSRYSVLNTPTANIWSRENRTSSDDLYGEVPLDRLPQGAFEPDGEYARIDGLQKLQGIFKWEPFVNAERKVTQDPFDQGQLYFSLTHVSNYLNHLGFDMTAIIGGKHGGKTHPMVAHANAVKDLNAWYSPQKDTLTFGTSDEKWHLASDSDVSIHESGHLILDHIHPGLGGYFGKEGGAIHEGFGDILAALFYDDPEVSEDFLIGLGKTPSKDAGLRSVNNNLTLSDVGTEVHDRGQVYAGFFWDIKKALGQASRTAADVTLRILINHASNYKTSSPEPGDFVNAVLEGTRSMSDAARGGIPLQQLEALILSVAQRRKLLSPPPPGETPPVVSLQEVVDRYGGGNVIGFERESAVPYIGGVQEKYQQYYLSRNFGRVPVYGRGTLVNHVPGHFVPVISLKDVRKMRAGEIDETIQVSVGDALRRILERLEAEKRHLSILLTKHQTPTDNLARDVAEIQKLQIDFRIIERCELILKTATPTLRPTLMIFPNGNNLAYDFALDYAHFYVDVLTGQVVFHKDLYY